MTQRIELTDNGTSAIIKMAEGNPGAVRVCTELLAQAPTIDPDCFGGGIIPILMLDSCEIYGSRIWMLYKDVCECSTPSTMGVLRALQLGLITELQLNRAIDNYGAGLDVDECMSLVQQQLPKFNC